MATDDDLVAIAAALCAVPLGDFTRERAARVKEARDAGDRDLAARIGALPKPSAAAWLIDLLAREHADDLDRVVDLGDRLREAQEDPDRDRLRALGAERRALLAEVAGIAADASEGAGRKASAAVLEEVQETLQAVLGSDEAAAAVRSGRLVRALSAEGLDPVDLTNAVAVGGRLDAGPSRRGSLRAQPDAGEEAAAEDDRDAAAEAERRERAEARAAEAGRAAQDARRAADDAASDADEADAEAARRADAADDLRGRLERLQREAEAADAALADAREAATAARRAAEAAARDAEDAERTADEADEALDRLRSS